MDTHFSESVHVISIGPDPTVMIFGILAILAMVGIFAWMAIHQVGTWREYIRYISSERELAREKIKTEKVKRKLLHAQTETEGHRQGLLGIKGMFYARKIHALDQQAIQANELLQQQLLAQRQLLNQLSQIQQAPQVQYYQPPRYRSLPEPAHMPRPSRSRQQLPVIQGEVVPEPKRVHINVPANNVQLPPPPSLPSLPSIPQMPQLQDMEAWLAKNRKQLGGPK